MSRRIDAVFKYAVLLGVLFAAIVAGWGVLFLQSLADATCPARDTVSATMRWSIVLVTLVLVTYCAGAGAYLRRTLRSRLHLAMWSVPAMAIFAFGLWLEVAVEPAEFCF